MSAGTPLLHPCPLPRVDAGRNKPPRGWQEGAVYACVCGQLYALRNRWNYAGDWWQWEMVAGESDE